MRSAAIHRLLIALLFPLLLFAQQGAFVHSLEHLPASFSRSDLSQDKRGAPADQYCEKCLAFAQIGAAANHLPVVIAVFAGVLDTIGFRLPAFSVPQVRTPRNRGPPPLL